MPICRESIELAHDCAITVAFHFGDENRFCRLGSRQTRFAEREHRLNASV